MDWTRANWPELLGEGDYRFEMRFSRLEPAAFFAPTPNGAAVLQERRRWLSEAPNRYAAVADPAAAAPLLDELTSMGAGWFCRPPDRKLSPLSPESAGEWNRWIGAHWEPDFLLLAPDKAGSMQLAAACVCFPSSWSLEEKLGRGVAFIHGPVPGLNRDLGVRIEAFLRRIRPGVAWMRANWGLSRSPERNQHPERRLARLDAEVTRDEVWVRVEHQALLGLPASGGVLFGIRIAVLPLTDVLQNREAAARMRHALRTMPDDMAKCKNLDQARPALIRWLESTSTQPSRLDAD